MSLRRHFGSPLLLVVGTVLPMVFGGSVYLLFRDTGMLMFRWVDLAGCTPLLTELRAWAAPARGVAPEWFLYSLPDGCWVFSCTVFFAWLWPDGPVWMRWGWIGLGVLLAVGGELGQVFGWVPGTFDGVDLVAYVAAAASAVAVVAAWRSAGTAPRRGSPGG